ncbi:MAG: hypothetical protein U5K69_16490 [Balneolaceae bacterium]|nr:hypothetical protein [Balneolaceae bacterium]
MFQSRDLEKSLRQYNIFATPVSFRVERFVTSPLPHRPVRADFPHTVPLNLVSLKEFVYNPWFY